MTVGISRIFRSTDASAPQLQATAGSLNAVLKAVLVNGYGSTQPIGWTIPFESGNVCVFRPSAGTRTFVRSNDAWSDPAYSEVRGYATMSSVDNGSEPVPLLIQNCHFHKKYSTGTPATPWIIIGDEAGIYILLRTAWSNQGDNIRGRIWSIYYMGDYVPWDIRNKWAFHIHGMQAGNVHGGVANHGDNASYSMILRSPATFLKGAIFSGVTGLDRVNSRSCIENVAGPRKLGGSYITNSVRLYIQTGLISSMLIGNYPGLFQVIENDNSGNVATVEVDMPHVEIADYNGNISLLFTIAGFNAISYISNPSKTSLGRAVIRVGRGFRNAF